MILSYKSPRHCFSYVVITRYFHITCKRIFYLKVGRENYHHNAQRTRLRSTCPRRLINSESLVRGYHKSWKQNFWLCQNGIHDNFRHEIETSIGQLIIFLYAWGRSLFISIFNLLLKKLTFKIIFSIPNLFIFYFICFSGQGGMLLKYSFIKIWTLKVLISFQWKNGMEQTIFKFGSKICLFAHPKTIIRNHRSPMML